VFAAALPVRAQSYTDAQLIDGFNKTVFGAEYQTNSKLANRVKKYEKPVLIYVNNRSRLDRRAAVNAFVDALPSRIRNLKVRRVSDPKAANYRIHVVDSSEYLTFTRGLIGWRHANAAGGDCMVRVSSQSGPIEESDAIIVSDRSETLFRRCMTEEILQGLGPVNDNATLTDSVFNDYSKHARFMKFDRMILNMLYDPRVRAGMTRAQVNTELPAVARDVQRRIK
jgi:hypothetical protein